MAVGHMGFHFVTPPGWQAQHRGPELIVQLLPPQISTQDRRYNRLYTWYKGEEDLNPPTRAAIYAPNYLHTLLHGSPTL